MSADTFNKGLEIRRKVLGDAHVERSMSGATPFTEDFQALVTEYCWGAVWGRDGLPAKTRSMLNIAMLTALNKEEELKLHLAGALRNGVSADEIKEILLQTAIYAGVPAANSAFRIAKEIIAAHEG